MKQRVYMFFTHTGDNVELKPEEIEMLVYLKVAKRYRVYFSAKEHRWIEQWVPSEIYDYLSRGYISSAVLR